MIFISGKAETGIWYSCCPSVTIFTSGKAKTGICDRLETTAGTPTAGIPAAGTSAPPLRFYRYVQPA